MTDPFIVEHITNIFPIPNDQDLMCRTSLDHREFINPLRFHQLESHHNMEKLWHIKPYLLQGTLTDTFLVHLINNYPHNFLEVPGYNCITKEISMELVSNVFSQSSKPHIFARDLVWHLFTLLELYGGKSKSGKNTDSLDNDLIVAIRNATVQQYHITTQIWQYKCVSFIHQSINDLFNQKLRLPTSDLTAVHLGIKFSCRFTLKEIQERWFALLYDPIISKLGMQAIKQLHPDIISSVQSKTLFSKEEEKLLGTVLSTSQPNLEVFEELIDKNPESFYPLRTPKSLHNHWLLMKQYHLLPDQSVQPMPRGDHVLNFSDAEDMLNDDDLKDPTDEILEHELAVADRRNKKEIRHLEQELPKWQVLVDSVTGISPPDFDNQTLAVLRGRLVRYLMRSREITLGRATKDNQVDVDLALEGPAWKISRRQGVIKLRSTGEFFISNEGKRPIYVDGKPILGGIKQKLNNNSVVEISCLRFIFLINQDLINVIRTEAQKQANT
ncbi:INO80Q [Mytilus edulis]|uniref:Microspherule protein 1 n=1 Tax=Mytilus edulis TaxID=6550 RepID=A0A8S3QCC5_MYTED|nr:INO80Q [Mytilus edulis]